MSRPSRGLQFEQETLLVRLIPLGITCRELILSTDEHFIIDQAILINSALGSAAVTNPSLSVDAKNKVVYLDVAYPPQVSIISGSGSGHEPSFTGYVSRGMLTAAVSG